MIMNLKVRDALRHPDINKADVHFDSPGWHVEQYGDWFELTKMRDGQPVPGLVLRTHASNVIYTLSQESTPPMKRKR